MARARNFKGRKAAPFAKGKTANGKRRRKTTSKKTAKGMPKRGAY